MSRPRMSQNDWFQVANRTHMVLSGALSDEALDQLPGKESRRPFVVRDLPAA